MQIIELPIESLTPYKRNARRHTDYQIDKICQSIQDYGFNDPIGVWGDENLIVEGHGRLMAAKKMGLTNVPCVRLDHLTEEQRKEYAVMHNHANDLSTWDWGKLQRDLEDFQFEKLGMDIPDFDKMGASQGDRTVEKVDVPIYFPVTVMENEVDYAHFKRLKEHFGVKKDIDFVRWHIHDLRQSMGEIPQDEEYEFEDDSDEESEEEDSDDEDYDQEKEGSEQE